MEHGRVIRPSLGISIAPLPSSGRIGGSRRARAEGEGGVLVVHVQPGGPAEAAGIMPTRREALFGRMILGDVIVGINGKPVKKQKDLFALLDTFKVRQRRSIVWETGSELLL